MNNLYDFDKRIVVKIIIENEKGEVLFIKEPLTNEWMPGRYGLPGGKVRIKESLLEAYSRKLKEEAGILKDPLGVYQAYELLFDDRSIYLFVMATKIEEKNMVNIPGGEYMWVNKEKVEAMQIDEFTEYFNQDLTINYLKGKKNCYPLDFIKTSKYYKMTNQEKFKKWSNVK